MTKELFKDGYLIDFQATVLSCEKEKDCYKVVLDQSAFYPEAGGQPSDKGALEQYSVIDVQRKDNDIVHFVDQPFEVGQKVQGHIDWNHRYDLMQQHTAEHIVSGLIHQMYGFDNVGFHMGKTITVDINGFLTWEQLMEIETKANEVIQQGIDVNVIYPEENQEGNYRSKKEIDQDLRIVEIDGVDRCACCGIHVANTQEIGLMKILSSMKHKGGTRFEMIASNRAMQDYQYKFNQNKQISISLKASPDQTYEAVEKLKENMEEKEKELSMVYQKYYQSRCTQDSIQIIFESDLSAFRIKQFCDVLMKEKHVDTCAIVSNGQYVIQSKNVDLSQYKEYWNKVLEGRGGGQKTILQGKWEADQEIIEKVLKETLCLS